MTAVRHVLAQLFARSARLRAPLSLWTLCLGCVLATGPLASSGLAQFDQIPSRLYFAAFSDFYDGDYREALREFTSEARGAIKTPQALWIDSICYETMIGECYYQMGQLGDALDHYTAAVRLYLLYPDWMLLVQFRPIRPQATVAETPWGVSTRTSRQGEFPNSMLIGLGSIDVNQQIRQGGVIQQAHFRHINVQEIVRCTTLAIRRRAELMGPAAASDPLFTQMVAQLSRHPGPPNHWSEAWIEVELGLALVAAGKPEQALLHLQRGVVAGGEFDHPMTSIALLELGHLAFAQDNYPAAKKFFEEATFAAVHHPDLGVLEEAFRGAALAQLLGNRGEVYAPLATAAQWAKLKGFRQLHTSLLLLQAENHAALGHTPQAAALLEAAALAIGRRRPGDGRLGTGRIGCRWDYLSALVLFQQKKIAEGDAALAAAMGYMAHGSYWLFHISLADGLYTTNAIEARTAIKLYSEVLRDPQPADWVTDPMEALAVLVAPHPAPIEHWFHVALEERKELDQALEIADRARRHRFFSSLPFGGRLQSLRWILEGPDEVLDQQSLVLRQDLLGRYPAYAQLLAQTQAIRARLAAMPLVADDQQTLQQQRSQYAQLADLSLQKEALLREMALGREPAELVFPPLRTTDDVRKSLPKGHVLLAFFAAGGQIYAFLLDNQDYTYWRLGPPAALSKQVATLLRKLGQFQQNHQLSPKELASSQWKQSARQTLDMILKDSRADFTQQFDELAVVPDGLLWYLPFEALQVQVNGRLYPLIERFRIRYAPTVSLAVPSGRGRSPLGNTAVVLGRLFPRDEPSVAQSAFQQLAAALPGSVALKSPLPGPPAVYGSMFDRLIVLDDLNLSGKNPYAWAPLPIDQGKPGSTLADWLQLPWQGPEDVILPGFHTAAESGLKGVTPPAAGQEVFLSVCGLMSSGAQTLLLSRWRTGGQTSFDLVREFAQELPHTSPAEAWQRAVFLTADSQLNLEAEPRVKRTANDEPLKANHPFFWAGYMLVDSGIAPKQPDAKKDKRDLPPPMPDKPQGPGAKQPQHEPEKKPPQELEKKP